MAYKIRDELRATTNNAIMELKEESERRAPIVFQRLYDYLLPEMVGEAKRGHNAVTIELQRFEHFRDGFLPGAHSGSENEYTLEKATDLLEQWCEANDLEFHRYGYAPTTIITVSWAYEEN